MNRATTAAVMVLLAAGGTAAGALWAGSAPPPRDRTISITARRYGYDPPTVHVNQGDRITLKLAAADVTHGFFLEGYDINAQLTPENPFFLLRRPSEGEDAEGTRVEEVQFTANRTGKFHYRCSVTCGSMHPFMQGEFVVEPNRAYPSSVGLSIGLVLGMFVYFAGQEGPDGGAE